ncbi:Indole-3-glycerol phosphate synthase [secondary endosymbiont of Heteropsylla cubana]|uniref:Multifunctional fusion protein n=1 Tax=secondary endosymbiont of Heteropsylla cubana TaxID=134287 RepID=J3TYF0_9ENTR|nr:bifunctional indole-3-glycerol-phosphate synthase TrpC/phosphoribosylanthranilate isomerase TrpF [secondary endosymbiont of Heteropsylla cubana]AFP85375.1 Indole-3-glycerol phosphate synthase [secondary endosymbiont of Heteropsylla cubana]
MQDTVLKKIILNKYEWVANNKRITPLESFFHKVKVSSRDFYQALSSKRTEFILECKKASPSKGLIRKDFDITAIANVYRNYASVISVLTDEKYFQGSFNYLGELSALVSQPVLCKDFIIDPWQIYFARLYQADAILLMLSVLDDDTYRKLSSVAHSLNMGILTEVISVEECKRAICLGAKVIGINNRDLRDLSIDLNRTPMLRSELPKNVTVISESGIDSYSKVRKISQYVNGFLIGSTLMSEPNLIMGVHRVLLGENKICGLTRVSDARSALDNGAIYGGLIFVPNSPRDVDIKTARTIVESVDLKYIGIFRDKPVKDVALTANILSLSGIQLHGNEDQNYIDSLRYILPPACHIWKAINMDKMSLQFREMFHVDRYILDNGGGGTGKPFNWLQLEQGRLDDVILAGGIGIDNCSLASRFGCVGLDFNSGVESIPGIKDHDKIAKVFQILRDY